MSGTISRQIGDDLARRLRAGDGLPVELTLTALARHYGVSFTPVREALRQLADEGLLTKLPNGRVVPTGPGPLVLSEPAAAPEFPDRTRDLETVLAAEVIRRSLRGDRGYLREEATAFQLGVGRTALRQAFGRLDGKGLLVHVPRCGWKVRPFDGADLASYLAVRETLEVKALRLARARLEPDDLRRMLSGNQDDPEVPRLDNQLHAYLVEKAGNPYIRDFFDRHGSYYTTLFDFATPEAHLVRTMAAQHREILQALLDEDWTAARRALARHIRAQLPIVEGLMRRVAGAPAEVAAARKSS